MSKPKRLWAVMKAFPFNAVTVSGHPVHMDESEPTHFIPVFPTKKAAVIWNNGTKNVESLTTLETAPKRKK